METTDNYLPPGDPKLVSNIVNHLKAQGIFDQFRHDCLADVDTKPSYQNLRQRVDGFVSKFLSSETWSPELNKNQLRNDLRRQIDESGMLAVGVEHVVEQVVNAKMYQVFLPKIEVIVREYLEKVEQQKEEVSNDKKFDLVDGTTKADPKSLLNDKPAEILKEVTGENLTKSQKCKEDGVNHESLKLDHLIRPDVEKSAVEKRGFPDRATDAKISTQLHNSDLKLAENTERKEILDTKKTPDGKSENRIVNSKLQLDTKSKPEMDVIRRLDKSWLKQREKARLKYQEPLVDSPEKNALNKDDLTLSPERNKTLAQNDLLKHSHNSKSKKSEDSTHIKSSEKSSKYKTSTSKVHGSKTKTEPFEESRFESRSTAVNAKSKSNDFGNSDAFKNTTNEGYRSEVKGALSGSTKSSKSTETKRESPKYSKSKNDYEKAKSVSKSESKHKAHKYSYEVHSSSSKSKSEKRDDDVSKKVEPSSKYQGSNPSNIPKKEKDDKNKYLKKELSVEKKLLEYNKLTDQKPYRDGRVKRESSISSQGSGQETRNNEYDKSRDKYDSKKTKWPSSDSHSKSKEMLVTQSNHKIKYKTVSDTQEALPKNDFKRSSPVDLDEEKSSSSSSMQESLSASSSESDNSDESGQSSESSSVSEKEKEMCSDGRRCNTPPITHAKNRKSRGVTGRSPRNISDSAKGKGNASPPSNARIDGGSSDTKSSSLNDNMFLSSASSSSEGSFLSHRDAEERRTKSRKKPQVVSGDESNGAWSCVSAVSSVHTSDLSSFDDQISLSSSDEEHTHKTRKAKKKKKKKLSLKEVKLIAEVVHNADNEESVEAKLPSEKLKKTSDRRKENSSSEDVATAWNNSSKDVSSSDEDSSSVVDSNRKNSRKRKRNPKYSSFFSPSKRADTRKSTDRCMDNINQCRSELHGSSAADPVKKESSVQGIIKKSSPKKVAEACEAKYKSNSKNIVSSKMDIHPSTTHSDHNESSSDFSDIISDDLSSDGEETTPKVTAAKKVTPEKIKSSSEDSVSSDDSDEETSSSKIYQKRKYSDSNEYKASNVTEAEDLDDIKSSEDDRDYDEVYPSVVSSSQSKLKQAKENNAKATELKNTTVSLGEEAVPRKRGRPRKYPVGHVHGTVVKPGAVPRKRGRPKKYPSNSTNDNDVCQVRDASVHQKTDVSLSGGNSNIETKGRQLRRNSLERTATRSSRRLSASSETSEPVTRPLRRLSEQCQNSSADQHKNGHHRGDYQHSSKWYDSSDLYKPRPVISSSSRRSRSHLTS